MDYSFTTKTPFANFGVRMQDDMVVALHYVDDKLTIAPSNPIDKTIAKQIQAYSHNSAAPLNLPIRLEGTPFQQKVWRALQKIPVGKVLTYGALAERLSTSARAVGNACRRNPVLLVVPCHRVVAVSGIGGFAGQTGGKWVQMKRRLLAHEGIRYR